MNRKYRKTIIAGNWKMNMFASQIKPFACELKKVSIGTSWCETLICVPFPLIPAAVRAFKGTRVSVGAQNVSEYESGAFTGEVSGAQLKDIGVSYVIVGHSERRHIYGETDDVIAAKVQAAIVCGLKPIICVGETESEREKGIASEIISIQIRSAISRIPIEKMRRVVIAYEPVWAIGTGKTATPEDAENMCAMIRTLVRTLFDAKTARAVSILYGGSMNEKNAAVLLNQPDIDGGLIGGASLDAIRFSQIITAANQ